MCQKQNFVLISTFHLRHFEEKDEARISGIDIHFPLIVKAGIIRAFLLLFSRSFQHVCTGTMRIEHLSGREMNVSNVGPLPVHRCYNKNITVHWLSWKWETLALIKLSKKQWLENFNEIEEFIVEWNSLSPLPLLLGGNNYMNADVLCHLLWW